MNILGTIYAPPLHRGFSERPTLRRAVKVDVASARLSPPTRGFHVPSASCRMVGLGNLGEADALARLRGLGAPGLPDDLDYWTTFED